MRTELFVYPGLPCDRSDDLGATLALEDQFVLKFLMIALQFSTRRTLMVFFKKNVIIQYSHDKRERSLVYPPKFRLF